MNLKRKFRRKASMLCCMAVFLLLLRTTAWSSSIPAQAVPDMERIPLEPRTVYLTFDDGPSRNTQAILEVLEQEEVPATFFVTAQDAAEYPQLYQEIAARGYPIGLHCARHDYMQLYQSADAFFQDQQQLRELIMQKTGLDPKLVRLPGGSLNSFASEAVMGDIIARLEAKGYTYFDWNVASGDDKVQGGPVSAEKILKTVIEGAGKTTSPVILLHDTHPCTTTPEATREIIQYFKNQRYHFSVLTEQTVPIQFYRQWHQIQQ